MIDQLHTMPSPVAVDRPDLGAVELAHLHRSRRATGPRFCYPLDG
jgi:hypothetical protein